MSLSVIMPLIIISLLILAAGIGVTIYFAVKTSESCLDNKLSDIPCPILPKPINPTFIIAPMLKVNLID